MTLRFSENQLRGFIRLALRHACDVNRPTVIQVQACLTALGVRPSMADLVHAITNVGAMRAPNVVDLRKHAFRAKVAKLVNDALELNGVVQASR